MNDLEDRLLDLALEDLYSRRSLPQPHPLRPVSAAVVASVLFLALASWLVFGRSGGPPAPEEARPSSRPQAAEPTEKEIRRLIERLSAPDIGERDRASAALKKMGPDLLGRLQEERDRAPDAETRARLQDLVTYWTQGVAARVDGEVVMWEEVEAAFRGLRSSDVSPELRKQALRSAVEERVFRHEVRRRGIEVTEEELLDLGRRKAEAWGGEDAYRAALRARGTTPERERERLRLQASFQKLDDRILEEARAHPYADPFRLDLTEPSREDLRRWYDANPDKFSGVDRVDVCWVELRFEKEEERAAKKALGEAIVAKAQAKKNLGQACVEAGVPENIHLGSFERPGRHAGPFGEAVRKLLFDQFAFGDVRAVEDGSSVFVLQLYDRSRRVSETFEQAEPAIRARFLNQTREANRKRIREGLLQRARISPPDLFQER